MNSGTQTVYWKFNVFKKFVVSSPLLPSLPLIPPTNIAVIRINLVCLDFPRQWICSGDRCVNTFLPMIKWNQYTFWHPRTQALFFGDGSIRIIFHIECHSWLCLICAQTTVSLWISKWITLSYCLQIQLNHLEFTWALIDTMIHPGGTQQRPDSIYDHRPIRYTFRIQWYNL